MVKVVEKADADIVVRFEREGKPFFKGKTLHFPIKSTGNKPLDYRWSIADALEIVKSLGAKSVFFKKPQFVSKKDWYRFFYEGLLLADYEFSEYKTKKEEKPEIFFQGKEEEETKIAEIYAKATNFTRDLVNTPPNIATPKFLADKAVEISKKYNFEVKVYEKKEIERMGMNAFLAVNWGSTKEPYFVHMTYRPREPKGKIVLVGKALTFDSGGLSIKTAEGMMTMKIDKSGACAVLGIFVGLGELGSDYEVHGIFAATENMPDGNAVRPGDIVKTYSGKTVEILNTDAEGRLTLADALSYASELSPDYLIDLATLTGAAVVALGEFTAALFSNDENLAKGILKAGYFAGERFWRMPLEDPFIYEKLKTYDADIKNSALDRWGGAIYAALFLKEFVKEGIKWAHIDLAGPVFNSKRWAYNPVGATGFAVRTMLNFITGR